MSMLLDKEFMEQATPEDIREQLDEGADVNASDKDGWTSLHIAVALNDSPEVIITLIVAGADVNSKSNDGSSPLHGAAANNDNPEVIITLVEEGADVNAQDKNGWTPLHLAVAYNKYPEIIKALLKAGVDENARAKNGISPLHVAAFNGNPAMIEVLIQAGADMEARSKRGFLPLHVAARFNNNPAVIEALIEAGADVNARTNDGLFTGWQKFFHTAVKSLSKNPAAADELFQTVTKVSKGAKGGFLPLHVATQESKNPEVVLALLNAGADSHAKTSWSFGMGRKTPLDLIKKNKILKDTKARWILHDLSYKKVKARWSIGFWPIFSLSLLAVLFILYRWGSFLLRWIG